MQTLVSKFIFIYSLISFILLRWYDYGSASCGRKSKFRFNMREQFEDHFASSRIFRRSVSCLQAKEGREPKDTFYYLELRLAEVVK